MTKEESFEDKLNRWTLPELLVERTKKNIYSERKLNRMETRIAELKYGTGAAAEMALDETDEVLQLLHPAIVDSSYQLLMQGHLRESVLNSVTAVFDLLREKSGVAKDGDALVSEALSLQNPVLILSEIESDSGKNDQKGFMQIYKGAYQGIRNPKAHSLTHDLTKVKALQYLVFASLLARRIDESSDTAA